MKLLLTGATGFLGSQICIRAVEEGHVVHALARPTSSFTRLENLLTNSNFSIFTIPEEGIFSNKLEDAVFEVDATIHTATSYGRLNSAFSDVDSIVDSNIIFPMNVMRRSAANGSKLFINTDSYFNKPGLSYSALMDYSTTKKFFAEWAFEYKFLQNVATLRLEHVYGPNDSEDKFVPKLINELTKVSSSRFPLSPGEQLRDFIHVEDVARAFVLAATKLFEQCESGVQRRYWEYEIGTSQMTSVRDFAERVKELSNSITELGFGDIPARFDEISKSVASKRFADEFGFEPSYSLDRGIRSLLETHSGS